MELKSNLIENRLTELTTSPIAWTDEVSEEYWRHITNVTKDRAAAYDLARRFETDPAPEKRALAADIYGQICNPILDEWQKEVNNSIRRLTVMGARDNDVLVLRCIAEALGFCYRKRAAPLLLVLSKHTDSDIRLAATRSLSSVAAAKGVVARLKQLTDDKEVPMRDWALFGLNTYLEWDCDTPKPRSDFSDVYLKHVNENDRDIRAEALEGLSLLNDERGKIYLLRELESDDAGLKSIRAAARYADPIFLGPLREIQTWWRDDGELREAIQKCMGEQRAKNSKIIGL